MTEQEYLRSLKSRLARCTSYKKDKTMAEQEYTTFLLSVENMTEQQQFDIISRGRPE